MSVAGVIRRGRRAAERLMSDTCTVTRAGAGKGPFNESTGQYDPPESTTVYTGKCRIQIKSVVASSSSTNAGDRAGTVQEMEWQGPLAGTDTIAINDMIHMDTAANDPSLAGREFTVNARHEKSQATARRLRVIEVTA